MTKNLVGISFRQEIPTGIPRVKFQDKHCHFIGRARLGNSFYIHRGDISCPLARFYFGIGDTDLKSLASILVGWGDSISQEIALQYLNSAQNLKACQKHIIYFPYPQKGLKPDVIIKMGTADEIMGMRFGNSHLSQE